MSLAPVYPLVSVSSCDATDRIPNEPSPYIPSSVCSVGSCDATGRIPNEHSPCIPSGVCPVSSCDTRGRIPNEFRPCIPSGVCLISLTHVHILHCSCSYGHTGLLLFFFSLCLCAERAMHCLLVDLATCGLAARRTTPAYIVCSFSVAKITIAVLHAMTTQPS